MGLMDDLKALGAQGVKQSEDGEKPKSLMDELRDLGEKESKLEGADDLVSQTLENTRTDMGAFLNGLTGGLSGGLDKLGYGLYGAVAGDGFGAGVDKYNQEMQRRDKAAGSVDESFDFTGSVAGALAGGGIGMNGAKTVGGKTDDVLNWILSKGDTTSQSIGKAMARIGMAAGVGGATEGSIRSGAGSDETLKDVGVGAAGAGAGQALFGEILGPIADWALGSKITGSAASKRRGAEKAGEYFTGKPQDGATGNFASTYDLPQQTADDWQRLANNTLGDGKIMGDATADTTAALKNTVLDPATTNTTRPLRDLAANRIDTAEQQVSEIVSDALAPVYTKYGGKVEYEKVRKEAGAIYKEIFDKGKNVPTGISRKSLTTSLDQFFDAARSGRLDALKKDITGELSSHLGAGKGVNPDNMTRKAMQNYLNEIDTLLRKYKPNDMGSTGDAGAYVALTRIRANVDAKMKASIPGFKKAASAYSDAAGLTNARELGEMAYRSSKITPEDLTAAMKDMSDSQKEALVDSFVNTARSNIGGDVSTARSILRGDDIRRQKLGVLIGQDNLDDFITKLDNQATELAAAKKWSSALEGRDTTASMDTTGGAVSGSIGVVPRSPFIYGRMSAANSGHSGQADYAEAQRLIAQYLMQSDPVTAGMQMSILDQAAKQGAKRSIAPATALGMQAPTILD